MLDAAAKLKPSALGFDIRYEDLDGLEDAVGVFFHTLDEDSALSDNLGSHNIIGLPEYFGPEAAECYWCFPKGNLQQIRVDLEAAGFTYVPLDSDAGEDESDDGPEDDEIQAPIINRDQLVHVGDIDVDAGSIWIGDGCYVLKDPDEPRPKDLGENWHDICDRFFERSGYRAFERAWQEYLNKGRIAFLESDKGKEIAAKLETVGKIENNKPTDEQWAVLKEFAEAQRDFEDQWVKDNPWNSADANAAVALDTSVANFTHDAGHGGMGIMMSTYYGDGSYPVYVEYGKDRKRPRRVVIDFDPGYPGEEESW